MLSKIDILGSSSKGCGYILTFDNGQKIQLDAGVDTKKEVDNVFITHHHTDHYKYIDNFTSDKIIEPDAKEREIDFWKSFPIYHTNLDNKPCITNGYEFKIDGEDIVYLTDVGDRWSVKPRFPNATLLMIECNWDWFSVKMGLIPVEDYSKRACSKGGHLSNLDTLNLIAYLGINKDCKIIFLHKSAHHGTDDMYKIFDVLPNKKYVAKKGETLYVKSWKNI